MNNNLLDVRKLTNKQSDLMDVLCDVKNKKLGTLEKSDLAGITHQYYYLCLKNPNFIKHLHLRNMAEVIACSPLVLDAFKKSALEGSFMQGKVLLECAGVYQPNKDSKPLVNIVLGDNQKPSEQVDSQLMDKIINIVPTTPDTQHIVDDKDKQT